MSELEKIKSSPKAKRILKGVHMDWEFPEISYTTPSQGGAASGKNEAYLFKAAKAKKEDLDKDQEAILEAIGEEFTPLQKSVKGNKNAPSSSSEGLDGEDDININKGEDNKMSEQTLERIAHLEKALAVSEAVNSLSGYGFETELNKAVANAIASLSEIKDKEAITKAFDALVTKKEEAVQKAKEAAPVVDSELSKALGEEVGVSGAAEGEVAKSLADRIAAYQEQIEKGEMQ